MMRLTRVLCVSVVMFLLALVSSVQGQTKPTCSLATLKGTYAYNGASVFGVGIGVLTADGFGKLSQSGAISIEGAIDFPTATGSYTVRSDCWGTMTLRDTRTSQVGNFSIVILGKGYEFYFIQTDPGTVSSGAAKRQ